VSQAPADSSALVISHVSCIAYRANLIYGPKEGLKTRRVDLFEELAASSSNLVLLFFGGAEHDHTSAREANPRRRKTKERRDQAETGYKQVNPTGFSHPDL
jgi:hypothetical protein